MSSLEIPICLITDNNYVMPTMVCIESMYRNKNNDSNYVVYVLADNITEESYTKIKKFKKDKFDVKIINIDNQYSDLQNKNDYVTNSAFLKFDIPNILNNYDKVLYIDSDTIVLKDLTELYLTELQDTYAGVVLDAGELFYQTYKKLSLAMYFNSGVILFNALKYRNDNISEKLLKIYKDNGESFICHDQDTFNIGFNENITVLSPIYNYQQSISEYWLFEILKYYNINKYDIKNSSIFIIHYTRMKPWIYSYTYKQEIWKKYASFCGVKINSYKNGFLLKSYLFIRGHLKLRKINSFIKKRILNK